MLRKHSLIYIALFALLSGCTGGTPSEADARQEFAKNNGQWAYRIQNNIVKVLSFEKINGQAGELMGTKVYSVEYTAQLEFLKNYVGHKASDRITVKGEIGFGKTEKGWQGKSGTVY